MIASVKALNVHKVFTETDGVTIQKPTKYRIDGFAWVFRGSFTVKGEGTYRFYSTGELKTRDEAKRALDALLSANPQWDRVSYVIAKYFNRVPIDG
jgi:hypothetical protein